MERYKTNSKYKRKGNDENDIICNITDERITFEKIKRPGKNPAFLSGGSPHDFIKYHHSLQDLNMELFICDDKNKIQLI